MISQNTADNYVLVISNGLSNHFKSLNHILIRLLGSLFSSQALKCNLRHFSIVFDTGCKVEMALFVITICAAGRSKNLVGTISFNSTGLLPFLEVRSYQSATRVIFPPFLIQSASPNAWMGKKLWGGRFNPHFPTLSGGPDYEGGGIRLWPSII